MQTRTGIFVPPIRRVVYGALAVAAATTLGIGRPACADPPARNVEDGSVFGDAEWRLTFEPSLALGADDEPDSASGWVIEGGPTLNLAGIDGEALVAGVTRGVHGDHADEDEFVQRAGLRPSCRLDIEDGVRVMRVLAMNHLGFRSVSDSPAPQPMQKGD